MKICKVWNAMEKEKSNWRSKNRKQRNFLAVVNALAKKKDYKKNEAWECGKTGKEGDEIHRRLIFFCVWLQNVRWAHTESAENVRLSDAENSFIFFVRFSR